MRVVVYGAGAVGGVVGAMLHRRGHRVSLIARGRHLEAIAAHGLVLELPSESERLDVEAVGDPGSLDWSEPAVVLLAVKSQDTDGALAALGRVAPEGTAVVCAQNGVDNERRVLRRFVRTYGMAVVCAATCLHPGVVQAHFGPVTGILDLGRYPDGADATASELAEALSGAGFDSVARTDIMRWKYRKLLHNLTNALEVLCGPAGRGGELADRARREGEEVLAAAGIDVASAEEDLDRRGRLVFGEAGALSATESGPWQGGSTWQSVVRGGDVEVDYLNGEIVLLGRLHGVATPVNATLQRLTREVAGSGAGPGRFDREQLASEIDRAPA
jgi:2-dehydropantoate 2-reductase